MEFIYFNPRSPCGERPFLCWTAHLLYSISIHAPRVGSDNKQGLGMGHVFDISIHAPRVGSDALMVFVPCRQIDFNPRSPCGERPKDLSSSCGTSQFQSTLPVWGATYEVDGYTEYCQQFQSTLPVWGATQCARVAHIFLCNFNPRSPCGERRRMTQTAQAGQTISIHAPRVGSDYLPSYRL